MKLKIKLEIVYPSTPPDDTRPYATRNVEDAYEQQKEIQEIDLDKRIEAVIQAFNNFKP